MAKRDNQYRGNNPSNSSCLDIRRHSIDRSTPFFHHVCSYRGFIEPDWKPRPSWVQGSWDEDFPEFKTLPKGEIKGIGVFAGGNSMVSFVAPPTSLSFP